MIKVLVFGNSQVGCIKAGQNILQERQELAGYDFYFAALPGGGIGGFKLDGNILKVNKELEEKLKVVWKSDRQIDVNDFDRVIIAAGDNRLHPCFYYSKPPFSHLSHSVIGKIVTYAGIDRVVGQLFMNFPEKIIFLGGVLPSEECVSIQSIKTLGNDDREIIKSNSLKIRAVCDSTIGYGKKVVKYFLPPPHVLSDVGVTTRKKFIRGGLSFDGIGKSPDNLHGNKSYGYEILKAMISTKSLFS